MELFKDISKSKIDQNWQRTIYIHHGDLIKTCFPHTATIRVKTDWLSCANILTKVLCNGPSRPQRYLLDLGWTKSRTRVWRHPVYNIFWKQSNKSCNDRDVWLLSRRYSLVFGAKQNKEMLCFLTWGSSWSVYGEKRRGPRTEPWGTTVKRAVKVEAFPKQTETFRSVMARTYPLFYSPSFNIHAV